RKSLILFDGKNAAYAGQLIIVTIPFDSKAPAPRPVRSIALTDSRNHSAIGKPTRFILYGIRRSMKLTGGKFSRPRANRSRFIEARHHWHSHRNIKMGFSQRA